MANDQDREIAELRELAANVGLKGFPESAGDGNSSPIADAEVDGLVALATHVGLKGYSRTEAGQGG